MYSLYSSKKILKKDEKKTGSRLDDLLNKSTSFELKFVGSDSIV